jgi:hypothetical protein
MLTTSTPAIVSSEPDAIISRRGNLIVIGFTIFVSRAQFIVSVRKEERPGVSIKSRPFNGLRIKSTIGRSRNPN